VANSDDMAWHGAVRGDPALEARYAGGAATFGDVIHAVGARVGEALLVLDDLPDLAAHAALLDRVARLAGVLRTAGIRVLATSQHPLPARLRAIVGTGFTEVVEAEYFSRDDVVEVLAAAGAPPEAARAAADAVLAETGGHPTLGQAAASWLRGRSWVLDGDALADLVTGAPLRLTREEARRTLRRTVEDAQAVVLVDRLSIIGAAFGRPILDAAAAVDPSIRGARPPGRHPRRLGPAPRRAVRGLAPPCGGGRGVRG